MADHRPDASTATSLSDRLGGQGYVLLDAGDFHGRVAAADLDAFGAEWESLPRDGEMADGGHYRFRRYGRLRGTRGADGGLRLAPLPHTPFRQAAEHVPLYAGRARVFAPIPAPALLHAALRGIVGVDMDVIGPLAPEPGGWLIGVHMVRIVGEPGQPGKPTPEGRHRDGHRFVGMHLVRRSPCAGGDSLVFTPGAGSPVAAATLVQPLDSLLVDDRACEHEVTPIRATRGRAVRDMLLIDFNPAGGQ